MSKQKQTYRNDLDSANEYIVALELKLQHLTSSHQAINDQKEIKEADAKSEAHLKHSADHKPINEALRESEARYRMIVETAQEGIWTIDDNSNTSFVNPIMAKVLGYSADEMLGCSMFDFMDDEGCQIATSNVERRKNGIAEQHDFKFIRKDGSTVWAELNTNPLLDADGNYVGALAMVTDMTERRRAEIILINTQKILLRTESLAQIGSWEWDLLSGKIYWSPEMYRIYQYDQDEFPDVTFSMVIERSYPDDVEKIKAGFKKAKDHNVSSSAEFRVVLPDDSIKYLWGETEAIRNKNGEITHMVGFVRDVTHAKKQEEQLRRSQKMDALGKLTGGIAHDYNNLLGIVLGYSHLLEESLEARPELAKYIKAIIQASERGADLSRKLMTFSRNIQPEVSVLDINNILLSGRDILQATLTPRIDLAFELADDLWSVNLNSSELEDAVLNLCINAMHAMSAGGKLTISTHNQHIDHREAEQYKLSVGDYVRLTVADVGCGIELKELNYIFDPFYTTKGEAGVGLGLSMVYGFVKRSAGEIVVNSTIGQGSQFSLFFPRYLAEAVSRVEDIQVKDKFDGSETILVVDDEPDLLELSKDILSTKGYRILTASNADEALAILEKNSIDLLLSDVIMKGIDGYQLATKIRKLNSNIKILLVSGYTENRHLKYTDSEIEENFLQKPYSPKVLLKRVRDILNEN